MDQTLLRSYLSTVYELPSPSGPVRVSLDGDAVGDLASLPELLTRTFAVVTAYNPRSMLLPRKVNDSRHSVLRDLLILGCYRVEACVGYEEDPDGTIVELKKLVEDTINSASHEERIDCAVIKEKIRLELKRFIQKGTGRRPMIIPVVIEV